MKQRSEQTYLRIISSKYVCTSCKSYRLLLSIQTNGTNARSFVNLVHWRTAEQEWNRAAQREPNERNQSRTSSYRATSWCHWKTNTDRIKNQQTYICELTQREESQSILECSLLWELYWTVPTLIIYKLSYAAPESKKHGFTQKNGFFVLRGHFDPKNDKK